MQNNPEKNSLANPLVTVLIPTFNEGPTLEIAVRSVMDQTYTNLEILVIDDGSTDDTKVIVEKLSNVDSRVKYLSCPYKDPKRTDIRGVNISVGYLARNYGLDQARGEWITFQDADDASLLNRIEKQLELAMKYDAVCVTTSWLQYADDRVGKKMNIDAFLKDHPMSEITVEPKSISALAKKIRGILMHPLFPHSFVPFVFKKRLPTRLLFITNTVSYPGADSAPFFRKETVTKVRFRKRDDRVWPSLGGRGVGRDHVFQLAEVYGRNYSFKIPLYLWRQRHENQEFKNPESYLE